MSKVCSDCRFSIQDFPDLFCTVRKLSTKSFCYLSSLLAETVFHRITASPKVLATTYVFKEWGSFSEMFCWRSLLIKENVKFASRSEAVKATIDVLCGE
jgi:hypothetical protein